MFWGASQVAVGIVDSFCAGDALLKITIKTIFPKNINALDESKEALLKVGAQVEWAYAEIELNCYNSLQKPSKPFKRTVEREKEKEAKRLKMTTFDESVKRCGCRNKCGAHFTDENLIKTREDYWNAGSFEEQNMIIANLIERKDKSRCSFKIGTEPKRNNRKYTISYNLKDAENDYRQVCQTMFLQTLGITVKRVRTVLKKKHGDLSFKHSGQPRNKISNDIHDLILEHLHCLPTVPAHYRRAESNKRYFEDDITPGILYKLFKEANPKTKISKTSYLKIVNKLNIAYFKPKNYQCKLHTKFNNSLKEPNDILEFERHEKRKVESRIAKALDKDRAKQPDSKFEAIIGDMEAIRYVPKSLSGDFYYISKLSCYNYSLYDLGSGKGFCYLWDQRQGKKGSNEIGSALRHYIKHCLNRETEELAI